ncbi:hypothetical protein JTL86_08225 [Pseudomonas aeruginosa]|nr:hypothetical protein [Pseudomonas aeruginosa]
MKKVTNTIKSASSIIAILAISDFSFNTFASEAEYNKSYSCVETAKETSCNLSIIKPTAEDKLLVEEWKEKVEFSTCSIETDEKIECNLTAYYEEPVQEASEEYNELIKSLENMSLSDILSIHGIDPVRIDVGNGIYVFYDKLGLMEIKDASQDSGLGESKFNINHVLTIYIFIAIFISMILTVIRTDNESLKAYIITSSLYILYLVAALVISNELGEIIATSKPEVVTGVLFLIVFTPLAMICVFAERYSARENAKEKGAV